MRCSRMRGYGSFSMGWRDAERMPPGPPRKPGIFFWGFMALLVFSFVKVGIETGNFMGFVLGIAVVAGLIQGMKS